MQYDFLKQFEDRMRHVGRYVRLITSSSQKQIWKDCGFESVDAQMNVLFAVLLFVMEESLREEICTIDDITAFLDGLNKDFLHRPMGYEECHTLCDFIINTILSNDGRPMSFEAVNFTEGTTQDLPVSFIANTIRTQEDGLNRISYYLTDDGYNLMLSTLEIENNMKLSIYEMIFKLHLEKQSYDKAADAVKTVFNQIRIQVQKIEETMRRVRRNALDYSVSEYEAICGENLGTVEKTQKDLKEYREDVRAKERALEKLDIHERALTEKEEENLANLRIIEQYLKRSIEEHQKVLNLHYDLKDLYEKELNLLTRVRYIKRFSIRADLFEPLTAHPEGLEYLEDFLHPLFSSDPGKIFHPGKVLEPQQPLRRMKQEKEEELLEDGSEEWLEQQKELIRQRLKQYEDSLRVILRQTMEEGGEITLQRLNEKLSERPRLKKTAIPEVGIVKEILVEMLRKQRLDLDELEKEQQENLTEEPMEFQLGTMLLNLREERKKLKCFEAYRIDDGKTVVFKNVLDADGKMKSIHCSNLLIRVTEE